MNVEAMSVNPKSRARSFIAKSADRAKAAEAQSLQNLKSLENVMVQYAEAANDYISARIKYLDILDKYQSASTSAVVQAFPGVSSHLPTYPVEEMSQDTEDMKALAKLIIELTSQLEALEHEVKRSMQQTTTSIRDMAEGVNQTAAYCDQLLTAIDSPYDAGLLTPESSI